MMRLYSKPLYEPHRCAASGFALITSLLLLLVISLMAVGMFHNFIGQEKIAGNVRDKQRSVDAATTAATYAEWWILNQGSTNLLGTNCPSALTTPTICANAPADPTVLPWQQSTVTGWAPYTPPSNITMAVEGTSSAGTNNSNPNGVYTSTPFFYITFLSQSYGQSPIYYYRIDAVGYGGSPGTVAVVESTYSVQEIVNSAHTGGSYGD